MKINRIKKIIPKKLLILIGFLILIIIVELGFSYKTFIKESHNYSVVITDNGFSPANLEINQGDSITFTTNRNKPFWPASDIHPTHTIYPEFDPKKPIEPDEKWSFIFNKKGEWRFHDHLSPLFTGKVIVRDSLKEVFNAGNNQVNCNHDPSCWQDQLDQTIKKQGLPQAFDLFTKLFTSEPIFAENCHGYTHQLGEAAYKQFSNNQDFPVTQQSAYCSYGFFHGFIEAMMQKTGNLNDAEKFCQYMDKQLRGQTSVLGACYHGIGHGITDGSDTRAYGDPIALIKPGLELCDKVGSNEYDHKICGTGVFNALAIMYSDPKYKLKLDPNDPFWACRQQSKPYFKHACFDDFKALIMSMTNNDFSKAAHFIEAVPEDDYAYDAMDNLATYYVYFLLKDNNYTDPINKCHNLQPRLQVACIRGLGAGFMTAGIPDKEYIRALEVCSSPLINQQERDGCYDRVMRLIELRYSPEKFQDICKTVDEKYRNYCAKTN